MRAKHLVAAIHFLVQLALGLFSDFQYLDATDCTKLDYDVRQIYRRTDPNYLQGLFWDAKHDTLIESTGLVGKSKVQRLAIRHELGVIQPEQVVPYTDAVFGEGMSQLNSTHYIWLTFTERLVNIVDRDSLKIVDTIPMWEGVRFGWGITLDPINRILYVSDGTSTLTRVDADTLVQIDQIKVTIFDGVSLAAINELEFVDGALWATIKWYNGMVKIDPQTGEVTKRVSFEIFYQAEMALLSDLNALEGYDHVNNMCHGIAYDEGRDEFYVTGKRWNLLFKIRLHQK